MELLAATVDSVFGLESRLWCTLRELTVAPGRLVRNYWSGQRVRYLSPVRYAVFTCATWWLVMQWLLRGADLSTVPKAAVVVLQWGQWLNLGLLPALAVPIWLAFLGTRTRYAEAFAALLFACGHVFLWRAGLALLGGCWPGIASGLNTVDSVAFVSYLGLTLTLAFWHRGRWVLARAVLAVALLVFASSGLTGWIVRWLTG
ncbi:MAG: DUF3667 domain-containing protein [Planctomycetes bacterium]|nr:DUF3667 domain-containing protein [Planctomycetota bacterium]